MKLFVATGLAAGVLNYLYQVFASRALELHDFAAFGSWFAELAVLFMLPSLLQYASNFAPCTGRRLKLILIVGNLCLLLAEIAWFALPPGLSLARGVLVLGAASLFGWLCGQAQIRLHMMSVALAGLGLAALKLLATFWPGLPRLDAFMWALFISYAPVIWFLSVGLWRAREFEMDIPERRWAAPVLLSLASAGLPQMDLVLLSSTLAAQDFARFVLASLFYKAIYFVVLAYLQWLLPHQVRGRFTRPGAPMFWRFAAATIVLSALIAGVGAPLVATVLRWADIPPTPWVFLACLNTGLLTWLFIQIQFECARGRERRAFAIVAALFIEIGLQLALRLPVTPYLSVALGSQALIALGTLFGPGPRSARVST